MQRLATLDPAALTDDECLGVFDDLELARRSLDAVGSAIVGQIEARGVCDRRYGTITKVWFERRHGRSRTSVGAQVRLATKLRTVLDELHAALGRGEITAERVELIASKVNDRNADAFAATQAALLQLSAAEPSFAKFAALIADLARYADADGGHDPSEPTSRVAARRVGDELALDGTYVGVDGERFEQLVNHATDRLWREWRRDVRRCPELTMPSRAELRAQALLELVRRGAGTTPDPSNSSNSSDSSDRAAPTTATMTTELSLVIDADRVDELDPLLASVLDGAGIGRLGRDGGAGGVGFPVSAPDGRRVRCSRADWHLLVCNSQISEVLLDALGMPVAARDRDRVPNRRMRRALVARDGGCAFPGCDHPPAWCDAHHVIEYSDDGRTVSINLVLLCRRHHRIVERDGWSVRLNDGVRLDHHGHLLSGPAPGAGFFTITTATGLRLQTQHRARRPQPHEPPPSDRPLHHRRTAPA